ncbi:hypothetical protein [Streptomyces sp. NPDC056975]
MKAGTVPVRGVRGSNQCMALLDLSWAFMGSSSRRFLGSVSDRR